MLSPAESKLAAIVASFVHKGDLRSAVQAIAEHGGTNLECSDDDPAKLLPALQWYLHYLLDGGGMAEAAQILWTPTQFNPNPECSRQIWKLFDEANLGLIMGAASMSKSFTFGVRLFLEWLRDPSYTSVRVLGPSEDHLEQNLFSHLVGLHQNAKLPMPGEVGELYIGIDRRNQLSAIRGVVIPQGKTKKAGRLQGAKRKPRPAPHPVYGALSRLFVFLDEIENIPLGIWSDIDNLLSNVQEEGDVAGMKIFGAYNPTNPGDEVYKRAEPEFGWADFDLDTHYHWVSKRGWTVLRLDGERCENVVQGKVIYPGLQTRAGLANIKRSAGGEQSAGYRAMGRGAYPIQGSALTIIPPGMVDRMRGELIWLESPIEVGSCDLALEGGASALFSKGRWGIATGVKLPPSLEFPQGRTVIFKDASGKAKPHWALQLEQQFALPKGDTVAMAEENIRICRRGGIRPDYFCCDRTGHGQGVADLMKHNWGPIHAVNYSEGASLGKVMEESTKTCKEEFTRLDSELWFALRSWAEFGYLYVHPQVSMEPLKTQLIQRQYRSQQGKTKVEAKRDYMARGFSSPDEADSLTLLVHAVRKGSGVIPSMAGSVDMPAADGDDDSGLVAGGVRIDPSNRTEWLQDSEGPAESRAREAWEQVWAKRS